MTIYEIDYHQFKEYLESLNPVYFIGTRNSSFSCPIRTYLVDVKGDLNVENLGPDHINLYSEPNGATVPAWVTQFIDNIDWEYPTPSEFIDADRRVTAGEALKVLNSISPDE